MRFSELEDARVGVWGAGREIRSFAEQLRKRIPSARIVAAAFDEEPDADVAEALDVPSSGILLAPDVEGLGACDVVVRSPGVSIHRAELRTLRARDVPVTTATALWLAEHGGEQVIGITGTKGKSTTAALAFHLARAAGVEARLAGNIGVPALDLLDAPGADVVVLELSSYQIADLERGPEVVLVTNLFREHLDWHGSEERYRADKLRILDLPGVRVAVLNAREQALAELHPPTEVTRYGEPGGWDLAASGIALDGELRASLEELPLPGEHNALNLCGALAALQALGIAPPLPESLRGFAPLAHRLEELGELDGVLWVNDSISTTPESALAALATFADRDVVLIGGGQDRGQDYSQLARALTEARASVVGVPTTGPRLTAAARAAGLPAERALDAANLEDAVSRARALARSGAVVLLSPAAPSYDSFRNFEERGERFRELAGIAAR